MINIWFKADIAIPFNLIFQSILSRKNYKAFIINFHESFIFI